MIIWVILASIFGIFFVINFFNGLKNRVAFREFFLMMYAINFLLSPAILYSVPEQLLVYPMKLTADIYFPYAIAAIISMYIGLYTLQTPPPPIFRPNINLLRIEATLNESILKNWIYAGMILNLVSRFFPSEIAFFLYLLSLLRFVGGFGLYALDAKKYSKHILGLLFYEFLISLTTGMFHDFLMWVIFFTIFYLYIKKPSFLLKIGIFAAGIIFFFLLQNTKSGYRAAISEGRSGIGVFAESAETAAEASLETSEEETGFFNTASFIGAVTRVNQAWILASTIDNMDRTQDFQGLSNIKKYAEAAFLPRVLAPDKLTAGDKELFNRFSGHHIGNNTSMGLGIFADGYIAYGFFGLVIFSYFFGLVFSLVFKIVYGWTRISPFFFLFIFPILNYAVRPDCEVQTILGHIVKSILLFSLVMKYYSGFLVRKRIALDQIFNIEKKNFIKKSDV